MCVGEKIKREYWRESARGENIHIRKQTHPPPNTHTWLYYTHTYTHTRTHTPCSGLGIWRSFCSSLQPPLPILLQEEESMILFLYTHTKENRCVVFVVFVCVCACIGCLAGYIPSLFSLLRSLSLVSLSILLPFLSILLSHSHIRITYIGRMDT